MELLLYMNKGIRVYIFQTILTILCLTIAADAPFAGWLTVETAHFRFYYEEPDRESVEELLTDCEEIYEKITTFLDSRPPGKVECIIRGRTDLANGFSSLLPPKIELFVSSPSDPFLDGARTENWLKYVFTHELTHYIHLLSIKGIAGISGYLFGLPVSGIISGFFLPGWAVEGITTNTETLFTSGGRGRNPFFEMFYKAPIIEKSLFSLDQAAYSSYFAPRGRIYVAGYILVDYLLKEYGSDFFTRAMQDYSWNPLGLFNGNIAKLTGKSMELIYRNMQGDLTLRFSKYFNIADGIKLSPDEQGSWFLPRITDRGWYVYRGTPEKVDALVRFDSATGKEIPLIKVGLTDPFSFTAPQDGSELVYSYIRSESGHPAGRKETADLYEYNVISRTVRKITEEAHLWHPALSPDGKRLVAVQRTGSYSRLVEVDRETGQVALLFAREKTTIYNPAFSPSGKKIVFTMKVRGMQDIYLLNRDALTLLPGSTFPANYNTEQAMAVMGLSYEGEYLPVFTEEDTLLFSADHDGSLKLYTFSLDTRTVTQVVEDPVGAWAGTWDGNRIIYVSYSAKGFCFKTPVIERQLPASDNIIPGETQYPDAVITGNTVAGEKKWLPSVKPFYWLPQFGILNIASALSDIGVYGGGLLVSGGSIFKDNYWQTLFLYYPAYNQVEGNFAFYGNIGKFSYAYDIVQDFHITPITAQLTVQSLSAGYLLYEEQDAEHTSTLSVNTGITHQFVLQGAAGSFEFMNLNNIPGITSENYISVTSGLNYRNIQESAQADLYGLNSIKWKLNTELFLPFFSGQIMESMVSTAFSWCIPLPALHHNLKLGLKTGWQSKNGIPHYAKPRMDSLFAYNVTGDYNDLASLLNLEYLYAFPLTDFSILGIPFLGFGSALHIEWPFQFDFNRGFANYREIYVGMEITTLTGYAPVGMGINARLDLEHITNFTIEDNLMFYIFIGFDSFMGN